MRSHLVTIPKVRAFRKIMQQLGRTGITDLKTLALVAEARALLREYDLDWTVVTIRIPKDYVAVSQRERKRTHLPSTSVAVARAAAALNGVGKAGLDGRALLRFVIARHPEWPTVRDTLSMELASITVTDLVAVAQILQIDDSFIQRVVVDEVPEPSVNGPQGHTADLFDHHNK